MLAPGTPVVWIEAVPHVTTTRWDEESPGYSRCVLSGVVVNWGDPFTLVKDKDGPERLVLSRALRINE